MPYFSFVARKSLPVLAGLLCALASPAQVITTVSGADWLFPGDHRPAVNAPLGGSNGLAVASDSAGNLFIADGDNHMVMKVARDGILTVVAGNGFAGFSGDGGPATDAAVAFPAGVAVDAAGNLYVTTGHRVRKILPDGTIQTIAGDGQAGFQDGPAASAEFDYPSGIAVDGAGNVYVADMFNSRVRKITPAGLVTTVAGNGHDAYTGDGGPAVNAALYWPTGLAFDPNGNLFIVDWINNVVREVVPDGTIYTAIQGNSQTAVTPLAVAFDAAGTLHVAAHLFIGASMFDIVFKLVPGGSVLVAGALDKAPGFSGDGGPATEAAMNQPAGLAFDPDGNLYIADTSNRRIRRVDAGGAIATVAGNGLYRYSGEGGPAAGATLDLPTGVALDPQGNLFISEEWGERVRKVDRGGIISTVAGGREGYSGDGDTAVGAGLFYPTGLAADQSGNLYIADRLNSRIRKVTPEGIITTVAGNGHPDYTGDGGVATAAAIQFPNAVTVDAAGSLYIADNGNDAIRKVDPQGIITTLAGGSVGNVSLSGPSGVAVAADGSVYIADTGNNRVLKLNPKGAVQTVAGRGAPGFRGDGLAATAALLNGPQGLAVDSAGNLYIADTDNQRIRRVTPGGIIDTVAGRGRGGYTDDGTYPGDGGAPTRAWLAYPSAVAVDSAGNLYIADRINYRVRVVLVTPPSFQLSSARLDFAAEAGGPLAPAQNIRLSAGVPGVPFTVVASAPWLAPTVSAGFMPAPLEVAADPAQLAPGTYQGTITIAAPLASPSSLQVNVTFTVSAAKPPKLAVRPDTLSFAFVRGAAPATQTARIANDGGGTLDFTLQPGAGWLKVAPAAGTAPAYGALSVAVTADPAGLAAGTYSAPLAVAGADGETQSVAVVMTVSAIRQSIQLPQSGLVFTAIAGAGATGPQTVAVLNTGQGIMSWTAEASTASGGPGWLAATPSAGSSDASVAGAPLQVPDSGIYYAGAPLQVSVNAAGLDAGIYYGEVRISAPEADNSPQSVMAVLNVLPAGSDPGPIVQPSGLVFTAEAGGGSPGSQTVLVSNLTGDPLSFSSGRLAQGGANWFASLPADAVVPGGGSVRVVVQPTIAGLAPGVYRGTLTLLFGGGASRTISLLLVLKPSAGTLSTAHAAGACVPSRLFPMFTSLGIETSVPVGWPNQMVVRVVDDCANPMLSGNVVVDFSTSDPQLSLTSARDGNWIGLWQVRNTSLSQVTLKVSAEQPDLKIHGATEITGGLQQNQDPPVLRSAAVMSGASFLPQAPVAPGSLISIFGSRLADGDNSATTLPLPFELSGTVVALAGVPLPLVRVSESRIDALVPYEVAVNTRLQMIVRRGASFAVPELVTVAPTQPAIFTKDQTGTGQGIVFGVGPDGSTSLAEPGNPVKAGDTVLLYCAGLGAVDPPVPAGSVVPDSPAPRAIGTVSLNIGGVDAPVSFAGLLPGLTGVYQVQAAVPAGVAGDAVSVVLTVGGQASPPVTMAVR